MNIYKYITFHSLLNFILWKGNNDSVFKKNKEFALIPAECLVLLCFVRSKLLLLFLFRTLWVYFFFLEQVRE